MCQRHQEIKVPMKPGLEPFAPYFTHSASKSVVVIVISFTLALRDAGYSMSSQPVGGLLPL